MQRGGGGRMGKSGRGDFSFRYRLDEAKKGGKNFNQTFGGGHRAGLTDCLVGEVEVEHGPHSRRCNRTGFKECRVGKCMFTEGRVELSVAKGPIRGREAIKKVKDEDKLRTPH